MLFCLGIEVEKGFVGCEALIPGVAPGGAAEVKGVRAEKQVIAGEQGGKQGVA